jgi:beta-lactamase regulating signal transducer with metallopeptidase domain
MRGLLLQTLTLSLAVCAVRGLQGAAMRRFSAGAAYACWWLVPVAMLAVALPHPSDYPLAVHIDVAALTPDWTAPPLPMRPGLPVSTAALAMVAWAVGAALLTAVLAARQRRFEALVAVSTRGAPPRLPAGAGPAVLGVWTRRIVLPQDFDSAFDSAERRLMLLHEGVHLRRADNLWNLVATGLLVLHWFNPFAWWAWRRVRVDQETACDAAVLRREPAASLSVYAGALMKVQGVALTPPFATSWQSSHPLVERVRMLQSHRIPPARHRMGLRIAALTILVAGIGGYTLRAGASAPPATGSAAEASVMTDVEIKVDAGTTIASKLLTRTGQTATARYDTDAMKKAMAAPFEIAYAVTRLDGNRLQIDATLRYGEPLATIASPRVITHEGDAAHIEAKSRDGSHTFAVSFAPRLLAAQAPGAAVDARKPSATETAGQGQRAL